MPGVPPHLFRPLDQTHPTQADARGVGVKATRFPDHDISGSGLLSGVRKAPHLLPSMTYPHLCSYHAHLHPHLCLLYPRTAGIPIDAHLFLFSSSSRVASSHPARRRRRKKHVSCFLCTPGASFDPLSSSYCCCMHQLSGTFV